jgi:hypothetical protein
MMAGPSMRTPGGESAALEHRHVAGVGCAEIGYQSQRDQADIARPFTAAARRPSRRARPGAG